MDSAINSSYNMSVAVNLQTFMHRHLCDYMGIECPSCKSQRAPIYPHHIGWKMKCFLMTSCFFPPLAAPSGLTLVSVPGCIGLHFPSNQRQTEGESSSECNRRLSYLTAVYRASEGFFCCLTLALRSGAPLHTNTHSSPSPAMITFILLQVGCQRRAQ